MFLCVSLCAGVDVGLCVMYARVVCVCDVCVMCV